MNNNIHSSDNEEEKLTEALHKVLPKNDYFVSLDSAIKNLSVNVNEKIRQKQEKRRLFRRRLLRFSPVFAASLCIVFWIVLKDNSHNTNTLVSQQASSEAVEAATLTNDEFNGIVEDEISVVLDDIEDFDDPILLFDSMTSSDVKTTIDELTESI